MAESALDRQAVLWLIECGRELLREWGPATAGRMALPSAWQGKLETWQQHLLLQQQQLRWRSRNRFPQPELWLWTERSLSQASDYGSAHFKAGLFPGGQRVVDVCCGAGADLVALARRGEVCGMDGDPQLTALAADNARAHGCPAELATSLIDSSWQPTADWLSIDPDRRPAGNRTTRGDAFSPPLSLVWELARRCRGAVIKLAPATEIPPALLPLIVANSQRVWLGNQGECRQQLLLTGELRGELGRRKAVLCEPQQLAAAAEQDSPASCRWLTGSHVPEFRGAPEPSGAVVECPQRYLYDVHSVLHAAELHDTWANQQQLAALSSQHAYYTADHLVTSAWAQAFEVLEVLPWDDRQLRKWLRKAGVGAVEVKSRGVPAGSVDANACQRRYSAPDGWPLTLLVTRIGSRIRGIAARRVPSSNS